MGQLRTLCSRLLVTMGGVAEGEHILGLSVGPPPEPPNPPDVAPYCVCGNCRPMPRLVENKCCGNTICVTSYQLFYTTCLDPTVLRVAIRNNANWRADPVVFNNTSYRKAAYRQYVLWSYGRLGRGNRRVVPSCCVLRVRAAYPSADCTYMGSQDT